VFDPKPLDGTAKACSPVLKIRVTAGSGIHGPEPFTTISSSNTSTAKASNFGSILLDILLQQEGSFLGLNVIVPEFNQVQARRR